MFVDSHPLFFLHHLTHGYIWKAATLQDQNNQSYLLEEFWDEDIKKRTTFIYKIFNMTLWKDKDSLLLNINTVLLCIKNER